MKTLSLSDPGGLAARRRSLSGSALKGLALVSMTIDHAAAALLNRGLFAAGFYPGAWLTLYWVCRGIGRLAFPIYCFLLAEGFTHTSSRRAYAGRLALFALLSELPFDLALYGRPVYLGYQNVFFTLLLGLLALCALGSGSALLRWAGPLGCVLAAEALHTDYGGFGVLLILVLYLGRSSRPLQTLTAGLLMLAQAARHGQWLAALELGSLVLVWCYNDQKGRSLPKLFFYGWYPAHLLIFWLLRQTIFAIS